MRRIRLSLRHFFHRYRLAQIGLLVALWAVGGEIAKAFELPLPGGIVGLFIALALLATGGVSLFSMKRGAEWFIAEMLLFFVPAVLAVLDHREFLGLLGLTILVIILASTAMVMAATALTIDLILRWSEKHERLVS